MRAASPDLRRGGWLALVAVATVVLVVPTALSGLRDDEDDGLLEVAALCEYA